MAQEKPNPLGEWVEALRGQFPRARHIVKEWIDACREEPGLIWATPAVRYITYVVVGALLLVITSFTSSLLEPAAPAAAGPLATSADFYVICRNPECEHHFMVNKPFRFDDFPVTCPKCRQKTGARAQRCNSEHCRGFWIVPEETEGKMVCPQCGTPMN